MPNCWIRFKYDISSKSELFNSLRYDSDYDGRIANNSEFADKCNFLLAENKEALHEVIKEKLIDKLNEIKEKYSKDNEMDRIKSIDKLIKEINKDLVIEID